MFFVGQPFRVAYSKAKALPYVNLFFAFIIYIIVNDFRVNLIIILEKVEIKPHIN